VTEVKDPSKYGVVLADEKGQISQFVEKPQSENCHACFRSAGAVALDGVRAFPAYVGNKINAGIYLFNPSIVGRVPVCTSFTVLFDADALPVALQSKPTSIEREIFPVMASEKQLFNMVSCTLGGSCSFSLQCLLPCRCCLVTGWILASPRIS
jgi:mannose-1-phosphate guanylyltransferase